MKLFLLTILSFTLNAQILTFNPFSNKVYQWDGITFLNDTETIDIFFSNSPNIFQSPVPISANQFYVATNDGKIYTLDLETKEATLYYESQDGCSMAYNFSGCIYSLTLTKKKELLFLLHERDGSDTLMKNGEPLVTNVPAPSGPVWIRPNGNIGLLPFGHGIFEIKLPKRISTFENVLIESSPLETMAGTVLEAIQGDESFQTYIFDFSTIKLLTKKGDFATFTNTSAATFDPCFGHAWYLNNGEISSFDLSPNPAACPLTARWNIDVKSSSDGSPLTDAHRFWDLPQGTSHVPNTLVFSLGNGGSLTLTPSIKIKDTEGFDIRIFENPFITYGSGKVFEEPAQIEVFDGSRWVSTECSCQSPNTNNCAGMQPTTIMPGDGTLAWSEEAGGFGIDLSALGISKLEKIRITDCQMMPFSGPSAGFDLDGIAINPKAINLN